MPRPKKIVNRLAGLTPANLSSPEPAPKDRKNFSYRKIDNGYLVNISGVQNGKYFDKEFYSSRMPKITVTKAARKNGV